MTATSAHRQSPCTSSPRHCHRTSASPAAAPKDRTDSARHADHALRRTAAAAHTNRHYPLALSRSHGDIHSSSARAVHIQAPRDQNFRCRRRRARRGSGAMPNRARARTKAVVPQARRLTHATAVYPAYRTACVPRAQRTARGGGSSAPHAHHPEQQPTAPSEIHWHLPADRPANRVPTHRRWKQKRKEKARTRSRRRKTSGRGDSSAFRSR
ncbi:hypothetical protein BLA3211_00879 [Burkholderia aenigmatica]|uniref:Uncharacterized protein n=1 Tax=Burkholderia aenigmatica TaxID=2015348 RepID=A0A6J5ILG1_9BURK|nr:hypothetical protein BLA3211_00879 [Burkholderia aenigmatica]